MNHNGTGRPVQLTYPSKIERVQLNIEIPPALKRALFVQAERNGLSLREGAQAALESWAGK